MTATPRAKEPSRLGLTHGILAAFLVSTIFIGPGNVTCAHADGTLGATAAPPAPATSILWMQSSAEYRALCLQTYRLAAQALPGLLEAHRASAAGGNVTKPVVVMDLDETVLDNSRFNAQRLLEGLPYSPALWQCWLEKHRDCVALVPGALAFIREARRLGIEAAFISNRPESHRAATVETLVALGVLDSAEAVSRHPVLLQLKIDSSGKETRRQALAGAGWAILALFGDNLDDFSEAFERGALDLSLGNAAAREERKARVDARADRWGMQWFVLPNPSYGSWEAKFLGTDKLEELEGVGGSDRVLGACLRHETQTP